MEPNAAPETQGLGKVMAILAWILVLLVLMIFFNHWININQLGTRPEVLVKNGITETILKRNENNQYLTEGAINGKTVTFLLDTGATDVVIPLKLAEELKLFHGMKGIADTAGGNVAVYDTTINELVIGHITLHHITATVNPSMSGNEVLLGMSVLRRINLLQKGDTLILTMDPEAAQ